MTPCVIRAIQFLTGERVGARSFVPLWVDEQYLFAAQVQSFSYFQVLLIPVLAQVSQHSTALAHQLEQAAAARFIVFIGTQVLGQLVDAIGQDGNLHFGRTGISIVPMKILNRFCLDFFC